MYEPSPENDRHDAAPGFGRVIFLLAAGAIALAIGWVVLYAGYRYLASDW